MRACVYTVLVGGYEELLEQPVAASSEMDFILFTDARDVESATWEVRTEGLILPQDPPRSSRYAKLLPHRVLPEYDVSIYIDNCLLLREPPEKVLKDLFPDDAVFALNPHDYRETVRGEFDAVIGLEKDVPWVCAEQLEHYEKWHPEVMDDQPLWTGFMIRRHHDPLLIKTMESWWTQLLRYSRRDQLSIMMALRETGLEPTVLSNPLRASEYHEWPMDVGRVDTAAEDLYGMSELKACRADLDRVSVERALWKQKAAELEAGVAALRRLLDEVQQGATERDELVAERDELFERLQMTHNSTSWRVTTPLRWLGDRMGRGS